MKRRDFLKQSLLVGVATGVCIDSKALENPSVVSIIDKDDYANRSELLIASAPMLQNFAETSVGVAFAVNDLANGYVLYGEKEDLSDAKKVKCGGFRVTAISDKVIQVRLSNLKPSTKYYYRIGADRISYKGGYKMSIVGNEEDPTIYSFQTAGKDTLSRVCVINDTHANNETLDAAIRKIDKLAPTTILWNGDASNTQETIESQIGIFINPNISNKTYASTRPLLFCPGNHDFRGKANRELEKVWMFRQPEERASKYWDLGRNFAVRVGDIALVGLDTGEDKLDDDIRFAGLFNNAPYREKQAEWLADALRKKEILEAPFLVAFCHIPLFDSSPNQNPGDVAIDDPLASQYTTDYAHWQRTCANLWGPLLNTAKCQLVVTGHQHHFRYDSAETTNRTWSQLVGGGPQMVNKPSFPTVIDLRVENKVLVVDVYNLVEDKLVASYKYKPRR